MKALLFQMVALQIETSVEAAVAMCCADVSVSKEVRHRRTVGILHLGRIFQGKDTKQRACC